MFKFEEDLSKLVFVLIMLLLIVRLGCFFIDSVNIKRFVENGYSRQTIKGSACVQWVK